MKNKMMMRVYFRWGIVWLASALLSALGTIAGIPYPSAEVNPDYPAWIWYPENPQGLECENADRYFRYEFNLSAPIRAAKVLWYIDDFGTVWLNGRQLESKPLFGLDSGEVTGLLKPGRNVLAVKAHNSGAYAGIVLRLEVLQNGDTVNICSNSGWSTAKDTPASDWTTPNYNAQNWIPVWVQGDVTLQPWSAILNLQPLQTRKEQKQQTQKIEDDIGPLNFLAEEPLPQARIEYHNGLPNLRINQVDHVPLMGVYQLGYGELSPFKPVGQKALAQFSSAGIKLLDCYQWARSCWIGPDQYDFTRLDQDLRKLLSLDHQLYFTLNVSLEPPQWWLDKYPEEKIGFATEGVRPPVSDYFQMGRAAAASPTSPRWRNDTANYLRALVGFLNTHPVGKRVVALRLSYGVYFEWHYYGMWGEMPDCGRSMTRYFQNFLADRYLNDRELQAAWHDRNATRQNALPPTFAERRREGRDMLRNPATDRKLIDYYDCLLDSQVDTIVTFAETVKKASDGRLLTGAYYGYLVFMPFPTEGATGRLEKLLDSPFVDFVSAPYDYSMTARMPGGTGLLRTFPEAFRRRGKLFFSEVDTRTHLKDQMDNLPAMATTATESATLLQRETAMAIITGSGAQYIEFGSGSIGKSWYDAPEIQAVLTAAPQIYRKAASWDNRANAEVAVIFSTGNIPYYGFSEGDCAVVDAWTTENMETLGQTGIPFVALTLQDWLADTSNRYKACWFLNPFYLSREERAAIEQKLKADQSSAIWNYAAGALTPDGIDWDAAERLTGIRVSPAPGPARKWLLKSTAMPTAQPPRTAESPTLTIVDPEAEICGRFADNDDPAVGLKNVSGRLNVVATVPLSDPVLLASCLTRMGVHQYFPANQATIMTNASTMLIHVRAQQQLTILLPEDAISAEELFTGQNYAIREKKLVLPSTSEAHTYFLKLNR